MPRLLQKPERRCRRKQPSPEFIVHCVTTCSANVSPPLRLHFFFFLHESKTTSSEHKNVSSTPKLCIKNREMRTLPVTPVPARHFFPYSQFLSLSRPPYLKHLNPLLLPVTTFACAFWASGRLWACACSSIEAKEGNRFTCHFSRAGGKNAPFQFITIGPFSGLAFTSRPEESGKVVDKRVKNENAKVSL